MKIPVTGRHFGTVAHTVHCKGTPKLIVPDGPHNLGYQCINMELFLNQMKVF